MFTLKKNFHCVCEQKQISFSYITEMKQQNSWLRTTFQPDLSEGAGCQNTLQKQKCGPERPNNTSDAETPSGGHSLHQCWGGELLKEGNMSVQLGHHGRIDQSSPGTCALANLPAQVQPRDSVKSVRLQRRARLWLQG